MNRPMDGNKYGVSVRIVDGDIEVLLPPHRLLPSEALEFAAWLIVLADPDNRRFAAMLAAVRAS